jgi:flagellar basal body-associated protein FliL
MIINLKDAGFLRVKLAVELKPGTNAKEMEEEMAPLRDAAISVLSVKSRQELLSEEGKEKGKAELVKRINAELGKPLVQKVFYTYFAIQ